MAESHSLVPRAVGMEQLMCCVQAGAGWDVPKYLFQDGTGLNVFLGSRLRQNYWFWKSLLPFSTTKGLCFPARAWWSHSRLWPSDESWRQCQNVRLLSVPRMNSLLKNHRASLHVHLMKMSRVLNRKRISLGFDWRQELDELQRSKHFAIKCFWMFHMEFLGKKSDLESA